MRNQESWFICPNNLKHGDVNPICQSCGARGVESPHPYVTYGPKPDLELCLNYNLQNSTVYGNPYLITYYMESPAYHTPWFNPKGLREIELYQGGTLKPLFDQQQSVEVELAAFKKRMALVIKALQKRYDGRVEVCYGLITDLR